LGKQRTLAEGIKADPMAEDGYYCCCAFMPSAGAGNGVPMAESCSDADRRRPPG